MALSGTISGVYRGYTLQTTWTATQSTAGNYSDITATHKLVCASTYALYIDGRTNTCTVDGTAKNFSSSAISTAGNQTITLGTTTHRVYHNVDGTKSFTMTTVFNMQADIVGTWVNNITATGTITLNAIPRQATFTSASNFNDEQNPSFNFSNAGGFQMSAYISFAGKTISRSGLGNATSGSYTFALTDAERTTLRNATPNSNTMTVTYGLQTVISGTTYTNTLAKTMTIVNASPTAPTLTYADTNSTTIAITGSNQRIIRNKSTLTATIGTATAKKGASITSYSTTINGVTKAGNGSISFGTVNSATNVDLITTVTDSRGNKATAKTTVTVDDWITPTASVQLYRMNNFETSSRLKIDSNYSSLNGKNTITCQYCYKQSTATTYSSWTAVANNTLITISLDNQYEYDVKIRIQDKLSGWIEASKVLPKGKPIWFVDVDLNSVGINCLPELPNYFQIEGSGSVSGSWSVGGKRVHGIETGSWTPTLSVISETAPTVSYTIRRGTYIRFGNLVYIDFYLRGTITKLNGTNNYGCVTGLPFTAKDYGMGEQAMPIGVIYNLTNETTNLTLGINAQSIRIQATSGSSASTLKLSSGGAGYFSLGSSGWYEIAT